VIRWTLAAFAAMIALDVIVGHTAGAFAAQLLGKVAGVLP
jgi:hypothetical protein